MPVRAVFFDVGNTLIFPHPSVAHVVREVLAEEGHVHDLSAIDAQMPLVDAYYEDRYRTDDTFWTDEGETSQVWIGMYSLLCRRLGMAEPVIIGAQLGAKVEGGRFEGIPGPREAPVLEGRGALPAAPRPPELPRP